MKIVVLLALALHKLRNLEILADRILRISKTATRMTNISFFPEHQRCAICLRGKQVNLEMTLNVRPAYAVVNE